MNSDELLRAANEALRKRLAGMAGELAHTQSQLGDALVRVEELESAIRQHYVATFGHSACFERDERLWCAVRDGKIRRWVRVSVPPKEEHRMACQQYRDSLFREKDEGHDGE